MVPNTNWHRRNLDYEVILKSEQKSVQLDLSVVSCSWRDASGLNINLMCVHMAGSLNEEISLVTIFLKQTLLPSSIHPKIPMTKTIMCVCLIQGTSTCERNPVERYPADHFIAACLLASISTLCVNNSPASSAIFSGNDAF